jgi:hypothetical protein
LDLTRARMARLWKIGVTAGLLGVNLGLKGINVSKIKITEFVFINTVEKYNSLRKTGKEDME